MTRMEELLAMVRAVNEDEFREQLTEGNSMDDLYTELTFLTSSLLERKRRTQEMIDHIADCFTGNYFNQLPVSDAQDELDVISMGFNTYMEELNATTVSKEELQQANIGLMAEKERSEKLSAAKDEFMSNMSHEIRTPLNGILGFVNILMADNVLPEEYRKQLEYAKISGDMLLVIINDILDIAKIDAGKMTLEYRSVNLSELSQLIRNTFDTKISEKSLSFSLEVATDVPNVILGDSVRISQILFNFVSNAIKFTPPGGKVELIIDRMTDERGKEFVSLSVTDTGIGIERSKLDDVFDPFVQTSNDTARKYGGTGLGLSIVRKIVSLMEGEVFVESEINKGSRFTALIPLRLPEVSVEEEKQEITQHSVPASEKDGRRIHVLLAEDNAINQLIVQTVLKRRDVDVTTVPNGKEAVEAVSGGNFDMVMMDIMMPEMDGYEATQAIRRLADPEKSSIPIVALTAVVTDSVTDKCREVGMDDYLSKPFDPEELYKKILALVRR